LTVVSLYNDPYVLVANQQLLPDAHSMTWQDAAKLPLALLTSETGARNLIDESFASTGAEPDPQVESDSAAVLFAQVATGAWASVVPYTWLHCIPVPAEARVVQLIEPHAQEAISVAVRARSRSTVGAEFLQIVTTGA
jgi:DNA-binding transcriptional LysR family regulator